MPSDINKVEMSCGNQVCLMNEKYAFLRKKNSSKTQKLNSQADRLANLICRGSVGLKRQDPFSSLSACSACIFSVNFTKPLQRLLPAEELYGLNLSRSHQGMGNRILRIDIITLQ